MQTPIMGSQMMIRKGITPSDVHVNRLMGDMSVAFMQDQMRFVAHRVFPILPVQKQSDLYLVYERGSFNRDQMKKRGPATETPGAEYDTSQQSYFCHVWGLHRDIDDQMRANADQPYDLDREANEFLSMQALIRREVEWAQNFFTAGVWTNEKTGVAAGPAANQFLQWNDSASTPIENVKAWRDEMLLRTGFMPNVLVLGHEVWTALSDHPDIVDRVKYGQTPGGPATVSRAAVAALMEIERIEVMSAIYNTAPEGADEANAFIGGKGAALFYAPPRAGLMTPSAGYTFTWTGYAGAAEYGQRLLTYRMDPIKSDRVEIEMAFSHEQVADDLAIYAATVVA